MSRIQVRKLQPYGTHQFPVVVRLKKPALVSDVTNVSENIDNASDPTFTITKQFSSLNPHVGNSSSMHNAVSLTCNSHCLSTTVPLMKPTLPFNWIRFCPTQQWIPQMHVVNCMAPDCGTSFNIFTRKYHCKMCGRVFCASCCSSQINVQIPCCHNEVNTVVPSITNSKLQFQKINQVDQFEQHINSVCQPKDKELHFQSTCSQLYNYNVSCQKTQLSQFIEGKKQSQNAENFARSLQCYSSRKFNHSDKQMCREKSQPIGHQLNNTLSKTIGDNHDTSASNSNKIKRQSQSVIKLPLFMNGQGKRQNSIIQQFQSVNKIVDVAPITASKQRSDLVIPTCTKCEELVRQKVNVQCNESDSTSNVLVQQDRQLQQYNKLITVYVCRACYYETQLVISKRQVNGQLRRKSRGEFKMFQRALLVNILSFLTLPDLAQAALVASDFYFMAKDNVIWYQYNVRRWTLDREQSNLSCAPMSSSLMWSGNSAQYRSLNYLNPFATLPSQPSPGQASASVSATYASLSSPQQHRLRVQNGPSSPLLTCSTSAPSFSQRARYCTSSLSASNLQQALMQDATALTVNEAARRVISLHSRYSFTQFLDFTRRQQMARCGGMAAFGVGYRILLSNPIKIAFLGPQHIGKTTCIRAFFDEDVARPAATHSTMGFTRYVRSIRLLGSGIAQIPVHIYDLSGDERYEQLWRLICRHCHVIALCYDASRKVTLVEAANMMLSVEHVLGPQPVITCGLIPDTRLLQQSKYNDLVQSRQMIGAKALRNNHTVPVNYVDTAVCYNSDENNQLIDNKGHAINKVNNFTKQTNYSESSSSIVHIQNEQNRDACREARTATAKATLWQKQITNGIRVSGDNGKLKHSLSHSSLLLLKEKEARQNKQTLSQSYNDKQKSIYDMQSIQDGCDETNQQSTKSKASATNNRKNKLLLSNVAGQTQNPSTISIGVHRYPASAPSTPTHKTNQLFQPHIQPDALATNGKSRHGNRGVNHCTTNSALASNGEGVTPQGENSTASQKLSNENNNKQGVYEKQVSKTEQLQASSMTISEVCYHEQLPIPLDINRNGKRKSYYPQTQKSNGSAQTTSQLSSTLSSSSTAMTVSPSQSDAKRGNDQQKATKSTQRTKKHCQVSHHDNNSANNSGSSSGSDNSKRRYDYTGVPDQPRLQVSAQDSAEITVRGAGSVQCPVLDASVLFTHLLQCLVDQIAAATMATTATIADISQDVIGGELAHTQSDKQLSTHPDTHMLSTPSSAEHSLTSSPQHKQFIINHQLHDAKINGSGNNKQASSEDKDHHIKYSTTYASKSHKIHKQSTRKGTGKRYKVRQAVLQELLNISTQPSPLDVLLDVK